MRQQPTADQIKNFQELNFFTELMDLSSFLEQQNNLEYSLKPLTTLVANLLNTENCSIMLLKENQGADAKLRVFTHHGPLPQAAYEQAVDLKEGIAGQVASTGRPLLVADIRRSPYTSQARRKDKSTGSFIACPLSINDKVIGVLNISHPRGKRVLDQNDLQLASTVALLIAKSIQVYQLQHLLHSNFVQLILAHETRDTPRNTLNEIAHNGEKMAKILAKSFFRNMSEAGFGTGHILVAATEIISLLSHDVEHRHHKIDPL